MKEKNLLEENKLKNDASENPAANEVNPFCGRQYNEEVPFSQINFQTFQNILDKRNELLNSVKSNHNQKYI